MAVQIDLRLAGKKRVYAEDHEEKRFPVKRDSQFTFIDLKKFELPADTVLLQLTVADRANHRSGRIETAFLVRDFQPALSLSDLSFIRSLHRPQGNEMRDFIRNGLVMVPNPSRVFSGPAADAFAWFYFEINHLRFVPGEKVAYLMRYTLYDLSGKQVAVQERPGLPVVQANSARVEKIALDEIPAGLYRLDVFVTEQSTGSSAISSRYVTVHNNEAAGTAVLPMSARDQERYLEQINYIATRDEKELFKKLDITGKRNFIIQFWQSKDPTPDTPENEYMIEHFRRLAFAENSYKGGLKSDMARIYIRYGAPMDIQRMFSNTRYNRPVEIWTIAQLGGIEFVFVDRNNDGHYVLVHSNHPDEYANPEWERDIQ